MKLSYSTFVIVILVVMFMTPAEKAVAQINFYPGYVLMLNGDTLKGEIKRNMKKEFDNFTRASYRLKSGAPLKTFRPNKIREYGFDGMVFVSRNVDGEQVFVKRLSQGSVDLYEAQIEVVQMNDLKVKSDFYMERENGEFVKIKSGKFKKQIIDVMADNEEIVKALDEDKYEYDNIVELFNEYNRASN